MNATALYGVLLLVAAAVGVARVQPELAKIAHSAKERDELYALPPPAPLRVAVLGWNAAAVDLLWANLLIEYGTHWQERRDFKDVPRYLDAILELEPSYWPVYRYADTMLAYRPLQGTADDAKLARAYLERGTRERPDDWRVWLEYGQFLAFIGPSFLHDDAERNAWRKDGAVALGHVTELGGDAEDALSAATLLTRAGARDQAIAYLRRAYVFTQHPSMSEVHEAIGRRLGSLEANAIRDSADTAATAIEVRWRHDMPFVSRSLYLLLGPDVAPFECAGRASSPDARCASDWSAVVSNDERTDR